MLACLLALSSLISALTMGRTQVVLKMWSTILHSDLAKKPSLNTGKQKSFEC